MSGLNIYSPVLPPGSPLIIVTLVPDPVTGFNPSGVEGVEFDGADTGDSCTEVVSVFEPLLQATDKQNTNSMVEIFTIFFNVVSF
jgi:hypothetical protein